MSPEGSWIFHSSSMHCDHRSKMTFTVLVTWLPVLGKAVRDANIVGQGLAYEGDSEV